jgi:poly-gamma-glutamate capsule biosynthesis protein CapA/YwtB (metallophosphatase superfamily)
MKKTIIILLIVSIFFFIPSSLTEKKEVYKEEKTYILLFAGDIMLDRGVKYMIGKYGEDYSFPFLKIKETLDKADLLFGNLESMISDKGHNVGSIYSFRADPLAIESLLFAGFNIVTLANNHTFDYTREAFEDTMRRLKEANITYTGAGFNKKEAHSPSVVLLEEEIKIGFLGYTEFLFPSAVATEERSGVTDFSEEKMKEDIERAKNLVDFLVVTFHYGDEYQKEPNEKQKKWSRAAIDYGADLVIGHHPHVTQPVENYNGKYIAYSLGNFVFDQYFSEETMSGFLLEVKIKGKKVDEVKKIHYKLNKFYQPEVVETEIL